MQDRFDLIIRPARIANISTGPPGREVISLQKGDSLLVLWCNIKLKRFCYLEVEILKEKRLELRPSIV